MSAYEVRRLEKIRKNEALLAQLNIPNVTLGAPERKDSPRPAKRRKVTQPERRSGRIAGRGEVVSYADDSRDGERTRNKGKSVRAPRREKEMRREEDAQVLREDVVEMEAGWALWESIAPEPHADDEGLLHFHGFDDFTPNKTPDSMLCQGVFGGSYYRPLKSRKLGIVIQGDWKELPTQWLEGLEVDRLLLQRKYDATANKYGVACGQSIEEWEAAGWIAHEFDVRGWFQWYTRFYRGRRCEDDARQVARWKKCVGPTGRWRRALLKRYIQAGVREVFDYGGDDEAQEVSPVVHQTCFQWAWEIRQEDLDEAWRETGR